MCARAAEEGALASVCHGLSRVCKMGRHGGAAVGSSRASYTPHGLETVTALMPRRYASAIARNLSSGSCSKRRYTSSDKM